MCEKRFKVALSFPGEHRDYVQEVAECLAETLADEVILYDQWYKAEFTRPNLDTYLQALYHNESALLVPFLCADYENKDWCQLEWRAIRDLIKQHKDDDIMPMRFDDTHISGLFDIDGYLDLKQHTPSEIAELILQRLKLNGIDTSGDGSKKEANKRKITIDRLPTVAGGFFGREAELQLLDDALASDDTRILQFIASGGTGKTKLLRHWLNTRDDKINNMIVWSFYSQGTSDSKQASASPLLTEAFKEFGVDESQYSTDEERADALVDLLVAHKCLLVLDGLEPLQHGGSGFNGQLKDRVIKRLLSKLLHQPDSLCIITSRIHVHELGDKAHVVSHPLDNLQTEDGVELLRSLEVTGRDKELQDAVNEVNGHALTLHLLGNALTLPASGLDSDIRKRDTLDELIGEYDEKERHAFKVMQGYQHWLRDKETGQPTAELQSLYLLGLFDHPIETDVLQVLWDKQIPELTEIDGKAIPAKVWHIALRDLKDQHRLLSAHGDRPDLLDCHPLIREYFGTQLQQQQPDAWQQAHETLYHYYKALPADQQPDSVAAMQPLFHAVAHGSAAGLHQQALDEVYWPRIRREGEAYIVKKLGAFSDDMAVMVHFFQHPWRIPAAGLDDIWQAGVLNWAGFHLRALGRMREAVEPMEATVEYDVKHERWKFAAIAASNLSELQLTLGRVADAVDSGERGVRYADKAGDWRYRMINHTTYADALHQAGQLAAALAGFQAAETIQQEHQPAYPRLYSMRGFLYCELLLSTVGTLAGDQQSRIGEVLERAEYAIEIAKRNNLLLDIALDQLNLGRAHHELHASAQGDQPQTMENARHWLDQAVAGLREAGSQYDLPRGLLARAALWRDLAFGPAQAADYYAKAQQDLAEVREIAEAGEMKLHLTDYHLEMVRLLLAAPTQAEAKTQDAIKEHVAAAAGLIEETGYHQRDGELQELVAATTPLTP